jgi:hypothetical protein
MVVDAEHHGQRDVLDYFGTFTQDLIDEFQFYNILRNEVIGPRPERPVSFFFVKALTEKTPFYETSISS